MKKGNIYFGKRNSLPVVLMLVLFSITLILIPSCNKEDDIPPPSAFIPPVPDTTGACIFLNVMPELTGDVALDFECEGPVYSFFGEKDGTITIEYVENPSAAGINVSEKVVQVTQTAGVEPWAGFFFDLSAKVDFSTYKDIFIKVYSPGVGQMVNLKLEDSADGSISTETAKPTTVANEWEELCFSFSSNDNDKFDRVVLFFDFQGPKDAETVHYFDDIIQGEGCVTIVPTEPTVGAPDPTKPESDVLSIFSDAYTNVEGTDFNPDWGQATVVTEVDIAGNNTLKYENLNYQGTAFASALDVSEMSFLHVDYWTGNSTGFNGSLISPGPLEAPHAFEVTTEEWVGVDIPLSEFSSVVNLMEVIQMKFDGNGTIFLDNIYFFKPAAGPTIAAPTPTIPEADVISIFSDAYTDVEGTDFDPDWGQSTETTQVDIAGNNTLKYENLNYQGTMFASALDVSETAFLHVDYWTGNSTGFNGSLISPGPLETPYAFAVTTGEWVSVDIPLDTFSSIVNLMEVIQMKFDGNGTIYLDNIFFHKGQVTEPTTAAPTPTVPEADVISMFSDAYTNVPVDTWRTVWSVADFEEVDIMGDLVLKYSNLNFVGAETVMNQIDISSMTHFHVDIWTPDAELFRIKLVDFGPNGAFDGGDDKEHELIFENPARGEWISLDIPLSDFEGLTTKEHFAQLIFSGLPSGGLTLFVDNVYFHN
jgi:hypothetical protein